jgi:hypothetical protein
MENTSCRRCCHSLLIAKLCFAMALSSAELGAAPTQFTVDPTKSEISVAGTVLGTKLQEQGPGSLVSTFSGTILANVSETGIQFPGGSAVTGNTNGVWKPGVGGAAGSAPADYGAQANTLLGSVKGALRNLLLDVTSSLLPLTNGQFDASSLVFSFPTNAMSSFDYDAGPILGAKGVMLTGLSTNKILNGATLTSTGGVQTLTIQVDAAFQLTTGVSDSVRLTGMLVATQGGQLSISSIQVQAQTVTLHVQGASTNASLLASTDLKAWSMQSASRTDDSNGAVFTFPVAGSYSFYRVTQ